MWWRNSVFAALLLLTGCGFQPVYGQYSAAKVNAAQLQDVRIRSIPDRLGQQLTNKLVDRLYTKGRSTQPRYELGITLRQAERSLGIQKDATATRGELSLTAEVTLYDTQTQADLYSTTIRTRVAYNILEGQYGNQIARENATDRALDDVANDAVGRIALFLNRTGKNETGRQ